MHGANKNMGVNEWMVLAGLSCERLKIKPRAASGGGDLGMSGNQHGDVKLSKLSFTFSPHPRQQLCMRMCTYIVLEYDPVSTITSPRGRTYRIEGHTFTCTCSSPCSPSQPSPSALQRADRATTPRAPPSEWIAAHQAANRAHAAAASLLSTLPPTAPRQRAALPTRCTPAACRRRARRGRGSLHPCHTRQALLTPHRRIHPRRRMAHQRRAHVQGHHGRGVSMQGLLPNARMVNAIWDDDNAGTRHLWAYPDTGRWNASRHTDEFVQNLPTTAHGPSSATSPSPSWAAPSAATTLRWTTRRLLVSMTASLIGPPRAS